MPQLQLPIFPKGLTCITEDLAFQQEDGKVVYFHGLLPVFQHDQEDLKSFRMFTSQLIANGTVRQRDISKSLTDLVEILWTWVGRAGKPLWI